jgi:hypothetical protein
MAFMLGVPSARAGAVRTSTKASYMAGVFAQEKLQRKGIREQVGVSQ